MFFAGGSCKHWAGKANAHVYTHVCVGWWRWPWQPHPQVLAAGLSPLAVAVCARVRRDRPR